MWAAVTPVVRFSKNAVTSIVCATASYPIMAEPRPDEAVGGFSFAAVRIAVKRTGSAFAGTGVSTARHARSGRHFLILSLLTGEREYKRIPFRAPDRFCEPLRNRRATSCSWPSYEIQNFGWGIADRRSVRLDPNSRRLSESSHT